VYSFLYLNPNITQGVSDGEFKFLGFQSYGANFTIDGQRSTNTIFGSPTTSEPSLEAVGELNVLSTDFSAEYAGIGNIRITTKRANRSFTARLFTTIRTRPWRPCRYKTNRAWRILCRPQASANIRRRISISTILVDPWGTNSRHQEDLVLYGL